MTKKLCPFKNIRSWSHHGLFGSCLGSRYPIMIILCVCPLSASICVSSCVSVLCVCLCVQLCVRLSVRPSACLSILLFVRLYIRLSVCKHYKTRERFDIGSRDLKYNKVYEIISYKFNAGHDMIKVKVIK